MMTGVKTPSCNMPCSLFLFEENQCRHGLAIQHSFAKQGSLLLPESLLQMFVISFFDLL